LVNKSDLENNKYLERVPKHLLEKENLVIMSAKTGVGEDNLIKYLLKTCGASQAHGFLIALNDRQLDLAKSTMESMCLRSTTCF
jgi:tRNA modification GTPase